MPVKRIIADNSIRPIKIWTDNIEQNTIEQLKNMGRLPFIFRHIAVMPDAHLGKGACVGSVIATKGAIIPSAVGVDIGCGMLACKLPVKLDFFNDKTLPQVRSAIEAAIPVGYKMNLEIPDDQGFLTRYGRMLGHLESEFGKENKFKLQLGTLGGGNHFIEICRDETGDVWCVIHSGSRGYGHHVAEKAIRDAKGLMKQYFIELPDPDLSFLAENTREFGRYIGDLHHAQLFAKQNRQEMLRRVIGVFNDILNIDIQVPLMDIIDCHHNYIEKENHFGSNVYVTRKGAVRARKDDLGIIPGSMGASTFIVKGLGEEESFCSCAHGAGRRFSRNEAKRTYTVEDLIEQTKGIECRKDIDIVDEIPAAYKNIDDVMEDQKDLVSVIHVLKQLICIKG